MKAFFAPSLAMCCVAAATSALIATSVGDAAPTSLYVISGIGTAGSGGGARIYELNPDNGAVLSTIIPPVPELAGSRLAFSGTALYYSNGFSTNNRSIYTIDPSTGAVLNAFPAPNASASGIGGLGYGSSSFGPTLYAVEYNNLYLLDPTSGALYKRITLSVPGYGLDFSWVTNELLEVSSYGGNEILRLDPNSGAVLSSIRPERQPQYDVGIVGNQLFSTGAYHVLRLNPDTGKIIAEFPNPGTWSIPQLAGGPPVPEPASILLLLVGIMLPIFSRSRRG